MAIRRYLFDLTMYVIWPCTIAYQVTTATLVWIKELVIVLYITYHVMIGFSKRLFYFPHLHALINPQPLFPKDLASWFWFKDT